MSKQKQLCKLNSYVHSGNGATTQTTSARFFTEQILNLHDLAESILNTDGWTPRIKSITINLRAMNLDTGLVQFVLKPFVVQTIGSFTDTADQTVNSVSEHLNGAINDVFGYRWLAKDYYQSRPTPNVQPTDAGPEYLGEWINIKIRIPEYVIKILNKETETERLQNLYVGIHGHTPYLNEHQISWYSITEVVYEAIRKDLVLR
jgi:hypothetical protein